MAIQTNVNKQIGSVSIDGRFDFRLHREFKHAYMNLLDDPQVQEVEVDMRRMDFIDSAGLGMLMLLRERAGLANKSIVLAHPSKSVSELFWVANFDRLFVIRGFVDVHI